VCIGILIRCPLCKDEVIDGNPESSDFLKLHLKYNHDWAEYAAFVIKKDGEVNHILTHEYKEANK
jgi:hypothetical protein